MNISWDKRQRLTNQLMRICANHIYNKGKPTPAQLYGLCKLTWITESFDGLNGSYIKSTKIPALEHIFNQNFKDKDISKIAEWIAMETKIPHSKELVIGPTGFTNFYKAYRNSSMDWMKENHQEVLKLFEKAMKLNSDQEGLKLTKDILELPKISKANNSKGEMHPQYLLTPVIFALDSRMRFPLINGNQGVSKLLKKLEILQVTLDIQYSEMVNLIGKYGINDAADLDILSSELAEIVSTKNSKATKKILSKNNHDPNNLELKDSEDIERLQKALTIKSKRIHNDLTNKLLEHFSEFKVLEGLESNKFDALVKDYNNQGNDLLIEVKSSADISNIRMAIGQLFDYSFKTGASDIHLAIMVPDKPDEYVFNLLESLKVSLFWFEGSILKGNRLSKP